MAARPRTRPIQHLEENHAQRPNIRLFRILFPLEDLRRHIHGRANDRFKQLLMPLSRLREPQIRNFDLIVVQK